MEEDKQYLLSTLLNRSCYNKHKYYLEIARILIQENLLDDNETEKLKQIIKEI